jgi:hypothetical protein
MPVPRYRKMAHLLLVVVSLAACSDPASVPIVQVDDTLRSLNAGYRILHRTLGDQQHLKTIRLTKSIVTFDALSQPTREIIDDIAQASDQALEELEQLAVLSPEISFKIEADGHIEQMTRDALRITTAKEFLTSTENFELVLLVSQTQALRYSSHLARELQAIETNSRRRAWLAALSDQLERFYQRVLARLQVA